MIDYINTHMSGFWITLGFILLAAEVLLFGFTTIVFLFAGVGAVITGLLMTVGILPETWIAGVSGFGICTGVVSAILWKPLQDMQNRSVDAQKQSSDLVGYSFVLEQDITALQKGNHRYSGVDWKVEIDSEAGVDSISAGTRVKVTSLDAGIFRVSLNT